jgi:transcriptional repressor NrdR
MAGSLRPSRNFGGPLGASTRKIGEKRHFDHNMLCFGQESDTRSSKIQAVRCPYCQFDSTRVVDSRLTDPGDSIRRRRECAGCGQRFTTFERAESPTLIVRKRDGSQEAFDRDKLVGGMLRAAAKRPVDVSDLEAIAAQVAGEIQRSGGAMEAGEIGERVMRGLVALDRVSALLFAAVYRDFEDLDDVEAEVRRIEAQSVAAPDQLPLASGDVPSDPAASIDPSPSNPLEGREGASEFDRRGHAVKP